MRRYFDNGSGHTLGIYLTAGLESGQSGKVSVLHVPSLVLEIHHGNYARSCARGAVVIMPSPAVPTHTAHSRSILHVADSCPRSAIRCLSPL